VCTPSTPACSGNIATTCNADGSGYATGGTDCGTLFCSGGACINAILKENFEDGNYDGWTVGTTATTYTRTVVAGGAVDTGYALSMGNTSTTGALDGLYRVFSPGIQPKSVSWWTKTPASSSNYDSCFRLSGSTAPTTTSTADVIMYVCFYRTSMYRYLSGTTTTTTHTPGVWVLLELRNIDWTAKTLDFYVNNTIVQQAARFYSTTPTSLQRIDLYTWSGVSGQLSYWDEIELLP
jgi:hypothetical protein